MDRFVSPDPEDSSAEDFSRLRVGDQLHQPDGFAIFHGPAHSAHRADGYEQFMTGGPRFFFRHSCAPERRVGVKRITRNAHRERPLLAVQEIGRHDLEIIVRRMREGASPIAFPQRPNSLGSGSQLVVDTDETPFVGFDLGSLEAQIGRIRATSDG